MPKAIGKGAVITEAEGDAVEIVEGDVYFPTSAKPGSAEPALFAEPGIFLVRPDGALYAAILNTMPFSRPHLKDMLAGLDFVIKNDYPARGEV